MRQHATAFAPRVCTLVPFIIILLLFEGAAALNFWPARVTAEIPWLCLRPGVARKLAGMVNLTIIIL